MTLDEMRRELEWCKDHPPEASETFLDTYEKILRLCTLQLAVLERTIAESYHGPT